LKRRLLLLSGYDAASHQSWRQSLVSSLSQFEWTQFALPGRHFAWRTRGNSLSFAFGNFPDLHQQSAYDALVVTSMVDLAALRGFLPHLASLPTLVYFHENQFAYPVARTQPNILNAQLTNLYTALCAQKLAFNSHFNRATFLNGVDRLLQKMPDCVPPEIRTRLEQVSEVVPVPINNYASSDVRDAWGDTRPVKILWNHRWEYDKQPEVLFSALRQLKQSGHAFELYCLGQSFREQPDAFSDAKDFFRDEIRAWGFQPREQYAHCLQQSDIVISTALHEFQGLSMLEAIGAGCTPIAPDRLAYREYIPQSLRYSIADSPTQEADNLYLCLKTLIASRRSVLVDVTDYFTEQLMPRYANLLQSLCDLRQ